MKDHTTFAIGGPADLFVTVREAKALQALLKRHGTVMCLTLS